MKLVLVSAGEFQMGGNETAEELVKAFALNSARPTISRTSTPSTACGLRGRSTSANTK